MPAPKIRYEHRLDLDTGEVFLDSFIEGSYKEYQRSTRLGTVKELKESGRTDILAKIPASQIAFVESDHGYPDPAEFPVESENPNTITLAQKLATMNDREVIQEMMRKDKRTSAEKVYLERMEALAKGPAQLEDEGEDETEESEPPDSEPEPGPTEGEDETEE